MKSISILDCTLRDGGYVNEWMFGKGNIKTIITKLIEAKIEIIECGFISQKNKFSSDSSQFNSVEDLIGYLPENRGKSTLVAMINYGEYDPFDLPLCDGRSLDGIRVAFHKKDKDEALKVCQKVKDRGYKLFLQPMVSLNYTDKQFLDLISKANDINPYAFYIVDSFGAMKRSDLLHLFYLIDYNLDPDICVGLHSHNNLQLSYSHAQTLTSHLTKRDLIIDSSIFGMGRGAGNLNTELFAEYLNQVNGACYKVPPLLQVMDSVIDPIYRYKYWGYSLAYYLSAVHNCHPNYATYLDNKNTLTVENINEIFGRMDNDNKAIYDKDYAEKAYMNYQDDRVADLQSRAQLKEKLKGKNVLILAPGKSLYDERNKVAAAATEPNTVVISVNFLPEGFEFECDFVFVSNIRRHEAMQGKGISNLIVTSNIRHRENASYVINYSDLLNSEESVEDNAAMMLVSLLITLEAASVQLAGLDGYTADLRGNFVQDNMEFLKKASVMEDMNRGMTVILKKFSNQIPITFVTRPRHVHPFSISYLRKTIVSER